MGKFEIHIIKHSDSNLTAAYYRRRPEYRNWALMRLNSLDQSLDQKSGTHKKVWWITKQPIRSSKP